MRILQVTETLVIGGAETFVVRICNELSLLHDVSLFVLHGHKVEQDLLKQISPSVKVIICDIPQLRLRQKLDSALYKSRIDYSTLESFFFSKLKKHIEEFK